MDTMLRAVTYALIPAAVLILGGLVAAFRTTSRQATSYLQHFAGGVVLAALTTELLPDIMHRHRPVAATIGFAIGTAVMLTVRAVFGEEQDETGADDGAVSGSMIAAVAIDLFIDGLLIGLGFAAGARTGFLLTFALGLEVLFLGLSTTGPKRARALLMMSAFAIVLILGAAAGAGLATRLGSELMEGALAFGAAALVYLVTEELLVEAHEVKETPWSAALFSAGFLVIMIVDMVA